MKFEALRHQGSKGEKFTADIVGEKAGESGRTVHRYIRLTELIPGMLEMVDNNMINVGIGERLSYLRKIEQEYLLKLFVERNIRIKKEQAEQLKKLSSKKMLTEEYFSLLSCEAKVLYGLMLDRMSLSLKNKWFDEQDRAYIIFTIEDVMELLNCKSQKAVKIMKELDAEDGIGLIEKIRQGFGKPNIIYVKNFMIKEAEEQRQQVQQNELPKNCENQNSVMRNPVNFGIVDGENQNSAIVKIKNQECRKSKSNYTDYSKTDISKNNPIYPSKTESMDEMDKYKCVVRKNINYTCFENDWVYDIKMVDELINLIVEIMTLLDTTTLLTTLYNAPLTMDSYYQAKVNYDLYGNS